MVKVIIQLGALTCPSCLQKIESAVSNASKVKAEIDTSQTTGEILAKTIEKLGYEVQSVKVKEA
ncbi:MAG: heavy metal-binding protein [Enterococcus sp.]